MKAVFAIAATVAVANAALLPRQLDQIPACALACATTSLGSTGCSVTDFKCICSNAAFVTSLTPCVQKGCSAAEFEQTLKAAQGLCSAAGVSLSIPAGAASTSAAATETSAAATTTAPATETSMSSMMSSMESSMMSSMMSSESMTAAPTTSAGAATTAAPTSSKASNGTISTTAPPQPTGTEPGAASRNTVALGGLGAIIALVAAFL